MKYGTVCSGIEAPSVAWEPLGWEPMWFSEIEPFPKEVLAHHYPNVPDLGDMCNVNWKQQPTVDVLIGGTPCTSFSVAGLRKGLDDPRGNLALEFLRIVDIKKPKWVIWENVPGVLSSNGGKDFGSFLGALGECGYGFAYRILDAQNWNLAQRRKRVFVVGCLDGWTSASAVLFESHCLFGNTKKSKQEKKKVASLTACGVGTCGADDNQAQAGHLIPHDMQAMGLYGSGRVASTCKARDYKMATDLISFHPRQDPINSLVTPPMETNGPMAVLITKENINASKKEKDSKKVLQKLQKEIGEKAFAEWGLGILVSFLPKEILQQAVHGTGLSIPSFKKFGLVNHALSCKKISTERTMLFMQKFASERCTSFRWKSHEQRSIELNTYMSLLSYQDTSTKKVMQDLWETSFRSGILQQTLSKIQKIWESYVSERQSIYKYPQVRRLTVEECEFLMGFPLNYTQIPWRNKNIEKCPDGHRYKALGNSMAVPVVKWLGERIMEVEKLCL